MSWSQGPAGEAATSISQTEPEKGQGEQMGPLSPSHDCHTAPRWGKLVSAEVLHL